MAMIVCPHCGEQVSENAKKCVHCGAILIPEEKKYCTECGAELEEGMTECPNCGCPVDDTLGQETDEKPQKVEVTGVKVTKKIKVIIGIVVALLVVGVLLRLLLTTKSFKSCMAYILQSLRKRLY